MFKIKKKLVLISISIFSIIILSTYFIFFKKTNLECSNKNIATWSTGTESVPEYLSFTKNLEKLTNYLGCKCVDGLIFCSSCKYDSNNNIRIYYYNGKFVVPPYEYTVLEDNIKKQDLSIKKEGYEFLFSTFPINLSSIYNLFQDGQPVKIISDDESKKIEINEIIRTNLGSILKKKIDDISSFEFKTTEGEIYKIERDFNKRKSTNTWIHNVSIYQKGMDYGDYRIDFVMDKIYFEGRKKVLKNLNAVEKFENQLFDIYLKTYRTVPTNNEEFILKKDNSIQDIYKIMEEDKEPERNGIFVYLDNFLVEELGGEIYEIQKYSFNGDEKGKYCENTWAIGGGGDSNPNCKIPSSAISVFKYIENLKEKCNR